MRVLIIAIVFAYAAAAPSGIVAPYIYPAVAIPAAIPTISPGDIQAAAIDAQVKINDLARSAVDKAQEVSEQAVYNINDKVITEVNLANEKTVEAFWSNEDKKWQALDALKTAEAQIDAAVANSATQLAKSTVGKVVPYVALAAPTPLVAAVIPPPIPPVVYTPYGAAAKSVTAPPQEAKTEENENKAENQEAAVKTTQSDKLEVTAETQEKIEDDSNKTAEKPIAEAKAIVTPFTAVYRYDIAAPIGISSPVVAQPVIKYAAIQPVHGIFAPTVVKAIY